MLFALTASAAIFYLSMNGTLGLFKPEGNDIETYNRGYLQGVNDLVSEAYKSGMVKIPFNETHYLALIPWTGD